MQRSLTRRVQRLITGATLLLSVSTLAACAPGQQTNNPTPSTATQLPSAGTPVVPTSVLPQATPQPAEPSVVIMIDQPAAGSTISSPGELRGRLSSVPAAGGLIYRILDAENFLLGTGTIATTGEQGQAGTFAAQMLYSSLANGPGFLQVLQRGSEGTITALGTVVVQLTHNVTTPPTAEVLPTTPPYPIATAGAPTPTAGPQGQVITIGSPSNGTTVGSPMTIVGSTARFPFQGNLDYRVVDAQNQQLGAGSFPVSGAADQPAAFTAEIRFNLPPNGGPIRVDIFDQDSSSGQVAATASLNLVVAGPPPTAGPQQITISSPPAGTTIGSPVTITGNTTRFPAQGSLKYRMLDGAGNQLGAGSFLVNGSAGQAANFSTSLTFNLPPNGGPVRLELSDRDTTNNTVIASTVLDMLVTPQPTVSPQQRISISSPPAGTTVGSPVTLTGNTANFPSDGNLDYRVTNAQGQQIGGGSFPISGAAGQPGNFVASLTFAEPTTGGNIVIELSDRDANGAVLASTSITLRVEPTIVQPSPTVAPPVQQVLAITAPISGTAVGAPFELRGTTAAYPSDGNLFYRVVDESGSELGSGTFNVQGQPGQPTTFTTQISFRAPAQGSTIRVQLLDRGDRTRAVSAQIEARYVYTPGPNPYPYPQPRT